MKKKAISAMVLAAALVLAPLSGELAMIATATGNNTTPAPPPTVTTTPNRPAGTTTGNNTVTSNNPGTTNSGTTNPGTTNPGTSTNTGTTASTYTVVKGDTLYHIARKCGMTLQELLAANPQIKNRDKISVGQVLNCKAGSTVNNGTNTETPAVTTSNTYTVVKGDTLYGIAKKCKMTIKELLAANPQIKNQNKINVGQVINVK